MGTQPAIAVPTWGEGDYSGLTGDFLAGTPALVFGTTNSSGTAPTLLRTDDQIKFPSALMSTANSATMTLTDDATDMHITCSLGGVDLNTANNKLALPLWNACGNLNSAAVGTILRFVGNTSTFGSTLNNGVEAFISYDTADAVGAIIVRGIRMSLGNTASPTFTSTTMRVLDLEFPSEPVMVGTNSFAERTGIRMTMRGVRGASATVTDSFGILADTWPLLNISAGTYTNAAFAKTQLPTIGSTIRRGYWLTSTTSNVGTESANTEGFYCEDLPKGTSQRASFYSEGMTTGTPTDVYGFYQGTAHVVGTNRYGARFTGTTTGTPTNAYGAYSDEHTVGTNRWSYWGANKIHCNLSDFIANASGFGFCNRDGQSASAGGGGTARYWRIYTDASATGVAGDVTIAIDSAGVITATRAGGATGTVLLQLKDVGTAAVTT
jgi:hypothetical protein